MVFFNYSTMQMAAKIVYYGPGLCGKTTNLHYIYTKTSPQSRGEMVSLETETDRTLFFDLLPIDVGVIGGFKTRLQLYTVPGQVFYNTTRKLVLKGVDGIVFVADSQRAMLDANFESFKNLNENLTEIGLSLDDLPLVVQLNKRDLPNAAEPETILRHLDPNRELDHVEAIAATGNGVFETLKLISKLTLRMLRRRMTGEEPVRPSPPRRPDITVRPREPLAPGPQNRTIPGITTPPSDAIGTSVLAASGVIAAAATIAEPPAATATVAEPPAETTVPEPPARIPAPEEPPRTGAEFGDETIAAEPPAEAATIADREIEAPPEEELPVAEEAEPEAEVAEVAAELPPAAEMPPPPEVSEPAMAAEAAAEAPAHHEPDIDFVQSARPTKKADVKHVKVRSSVDIMAELEALRKRATQSSPKSRKESSGAATAPKAKRNLHRTMSLEAAPGTRSRTRSVRITVSFEDGEGVLQSQDQSIDLAESSDVGSLSVDLKIALE